MKIIALLSLLSLSSLPSLRAGEVTIADDGTCTKDGQQLNNVWDELLNKRITNAECAAAWRAKMKQLADARAAADKAKADADLKAAAAVNEIKKRKAAEEATGKGKKWEALDELEGALNLTADDLREKQLDEQIAALQAQKRKK